MSRKWNLRSEQNLESYSPWSCCIIDQGPVARSPVSANRWLRGIKTDRFPWYLTLVSANHASSNPGQGAKATKRNAWSFLLYSSSTKDFTWNDLWISTRTRLNNIFFLLIDCKTRNQHQQVARPGDHEYIFGRPRPNVSRLRRPGAVRAQPCMYLRKCHLLHNLYVMQ